MPDGNRGHIKEEGIGHTVRVSKWRKKASIRLVGASGLRSSELYEPQMMHLVSGARLEETEEQTVKKRGKRI